ncbi:MAG: hypothetical protein ACRDKJ_02460 [Actinomycetota bacterium]
MSSFAGLLFLLGGIALFITAVLFLVAWERSGHSARRSLERFERTRRSLHKIHHAQATLRESARARARAMHPSGRRVRLHRARHRKGA